MSCSRCQDLIVRIDLEDAGSSTYCFSGWHRLLCGEVTGAGIKAIGNAIRHRWGTGFVDKVPS